MWSRIQSGGDIPGRSRHPAPNNRSGSISVLFFQNRNLDIPPARPALRDDQIFDSALSCSNKKTFKLERQHILYGGCTCKNKYSGAGGNIREENIRDAGGITGWGIFSQRAAAGAYPPRTCQNKSPVADPEYSGRARADPPLRPAQAGDSAGGATSRKEASCPQPRPPAPLPSAPICAASCGSACSLSRLGRTSSTTFSAPSGGRRRRRRRIWRR